MAANQLKEQEKMTDPDFFEWQAYVLIFFLFLDQFSTVIITIISGISGICGLYERKLKDLNPAILNITYDIADLYNFIDGLADMSALVYVLFFTSSSCISL